jgi:predicted DCC family thiol-disulfide oxidoreductase YuxK
MHPVDVSNLAELGDRLVVVFDGYCGLCNRTVRWLVRRDRRDRLRYVASESEIAAALLARHGISLPDAESGPTTILVVLSFGGSEEQVLARSEAVLALLTELPQPWPAVAVALGWIPRPLRDLGYRLVARWRYRIWGRLEICTISGAHERERFL